MSDARVRSREFAAPFHGVRAAHGVETDPEALARAYAVKMRRDAAFSHVTAAQLLGAPLPVRFTASPLHITVPTGTSPVRGRGIVGHHGRFDGPALELHGLRVLPPASAWLTLGETLDVPDLVAVADALITATPSPGGVVRCRRPRRHSSRSSSRTRSERAPRRSRLRSTGSSIATRVASAGAPRRRWLSGASPQLHRARASVSGRPRLARVQVRDGVRRSVPRVPRSGAGGLQSPRAHP
jgi:hypothetical protein